MSIKKQEKRLANQEGMPLTRRHFVQASAALVSMLFSHKMHRPILIKAYLLPTLMRNLLLSSQHAAPLTVVVNVISELMLKRELLPVLPQDQMLI